MDPQERGKLLTTPTAAALSKNLTSPSSHSSVVTRGGTVASPHPDNAVLFTDEGVPKFLPRKTWAARPQNGPSALRGQGSGSRAAQKSGAGPSSSSSSSSSSSDSGSDEEGDGSAVGSHAMGKVRGGVPRSGASPSSENRSPKISLSARETAWSPQPHQDLTSAEGPHQAKKKGASIKPLKVRKDEPKPTISKSQVDKEFMKESVKGKKVQKILSSDTTDKESQRPCEAIDVPSDHTKSGESAQPSRGPGPTRLTGTAGGRQLQAAPPETRGRRLQKQGPEPNGAVAFSPFKKENLGKQVIEGISKANEEILEEQEPITNLKPVPVQSKAMFDEKTAELKLEAKGELAEDPATRAGGQDDTQGIYLAAATSPCPPGVGRLKSCRIERSATTNQVPQ